MERATIPVLLITGPPGVGKSSAAERVSDLFAQAGVEHAVVDLDELDRHTGSAGPDLHFANLAAVWSNYAAAGAARLVLAWTLDSRGELDRLREAVPGACVRVCRLRARSATVVERVALREPPLMREQLKALALKYADRMEREELGDYVVDSEGRSLDEVAAEVAARAAWLPERDGAEVPLPGGRLTEGVVRVGDSVRRPLNPRSAFVHRLLCHLEQGGFQGAPRFRGVDGRDREILTFVEGWVPPDLDHWADEQVAAAARMLRRYHDATAGSELAEGEEVICHNDPSPCNYVFADALPRALIDFDAAAPGRRLRDVAYACWLWILSSDDDAPTPREQARQLDIFLEAYGSEQRVVLIDAVARRQRENLQAVRSRGRSDDPAVADYARSSIEWHRREMAWLAEHRDELAALLAAT
ncbi:MAG: phosphotransferase [Solirubrobacteraceae bacterium]